jgi:hypothetical protein
MNSPKDIEKSLQRLMPAALSTSAERNISQMLSDLAASPAISEKPCPTALISINRRRILAVAALLVATSPLWIAWKPKINTPSQFALAPAPASSQAQNKRDAVLIDRMLVTDEADDDQFITASDGSILKQINRKVLTRERYRTEKHGYLITISESRAEQVLVPKKRF